MARLVIRETRNGLKQIIVQVIILCYFRKQ